MKPSEAPVAFRIRSLNNQLRRLFERTAIKENAAELTGMQYAILGFLGEQDEAADVYQRDIEAEFNIRRSTASEMLKLLEKKGFIVRVTDTEDTRMKKITMTEKAKELDKIALANIEKIQIRLTKGIPPKEMEQFYKTLEKISKNAQD